MAIKIHQVRSASVASARDSSFAVQDFASGSVRKMTGAPDIVQLRGADGAQSGNDWSPRAILVVGKINRIGGALKLIHSSQAGYLRSLVVTRAAEHPCIVNVTDQLPSIRITGTSVDLDPSIVVPHVAPKPRR